MVWSKSPKYSTLLGLALDDRRIQGVVAHRSNGHVEVIRHFSFTLSLEPLTNDPELVGRELRNFLNEAGIRERRCVICLPASWALTMSCKLPEITEAEIPGFLQLEAEQGLPYSPDDLAICHSFVQVAGGAKSATLFALQRSHLNHLNKVLQTAKLEALFITLGISALQPLTAQDNTGILLLSAAESGVEMLMRAGGGMAALRALEGAVESEGSQIRMDADLVNREVRITLGQLAPEWRESIKKIFVYGRPDLANPLLNSLTGFAEVKGITHAAGPMPEGIRSGALSAADAGLVSVMELVSRLLMGNPPELDFLPPKINPLTQLLARFSSRKIAYIGAAIIGLAFLIGAAFGWQQWNLSSLESQWRGMRSKVTELDGMQQDIRKYRAWNDKSHRALRILQRITEAFPEEGSVTAKILQIKDLTEISCSGQARDNQSLYRMMEKLREGGQVKEIKTVQVRGKSPILFNLTFKWVEGAARER